MKTKTTRKEIYTRYGKENTVSLKEWHFPNLDKFKKPEHFTSGDFGWNSDIYDFGTFAISMGFYPFGTNNARLVRLCTEYNNRFRFADAETDGGLLEDFTREMRELLDEMQQGRE